MDMNVSQLLREPIGSTREYDIDEDIDIGGDKTTTNRIKGTCSLLRTQRSILVQCNLASEAECTCSRCLSTFKQPVRFKFNEEFFPAVDIQTGVMLPPPEESNAFTIDEQHTLDLTEAIRQYFLLAVPMKPLCKKDCAGLCAQCGKNLNQGKCDCTTEIDPRWSKLAGLQ